MPTPTTSVVICCYSEARFDDVRAAVRSVAEQSLPPLETVVVVDHNPALRTRLAAALPGTVLVDNDGPHGLSGARNSGIAATTGDIVVFLDDDARADTNMLLAMVFSGQAPSVLGVAGRIVPDWIGGTPAWFPGEFLWVVGCTYVGLAAGPVRNPIGAAMAVRRSVLDVVGGFDTGLGRTHDSLPLGCEETELAIRANKAFPGMHFVHATDAFCHHRVPPARATWSYLATRCWAEGLSKASLSKLAGTGSALSSEGAYVRNVLPRGFVRGLYDALRGDGAGALRSAAIVLGLACTTAGYAVGRLRLAASRHQPVPGKRRLMEAVLDPGQGPLHRLRATVLRHATLLANAGALATGTLATAVLGFAYWWVAARAFPPEAVGLAAAAVSMMTLLAQAGEIGLGPLLVGQVPRNPSGAPALIWTALFTAALGCAAAGGAYVALAQAFPLGMGTMLASPAGGLLFAAGVAATGISLVLDQALVGLMRSSVAMWRSIVFAAGKLALLVAVAGLVTSATGADILATWIVGQVASLALLAALVALGKGRPKVAPDATATRRWHRPTPALLRPLAGDILGHHCVNVALQAPALVLPFIVTVTLSAETNAAFYAAWSLINVALLVPASLATVVYSTGSGDPARLAPGLRMSLGISALAGIGTGLAFLLFSPFILRLFSPGYPAIAGAGLQVLGFGTLAVAVKYHYVAVERLHGRMGIAAIALALGGILELSGAVAGARYGGLTGLTQGWLAAACLQALLMAPRVLSAAFPDGNPMRRQVAKATGHAAALAMLAGLSWTLATDQSAAGAPRPGFVYREGTAFMLDGKPFRVAGVNNHYLAFGSREEVVRVLDDAVAMGANVVRTFVQPVIGSPDGKMPTIWNWKGTQDSSELGAKSRHVLYWDSAANKMAFNDGPDGLARMDFVLDEARKRNLRLIVALVDFWGYTGGAQQMSAWYGSKDKYTFFASDPRTRQDYKDWAVHVLTRTNALTGKAYKDDPTVMAWELANEPDIHPITLLMDWVSQMSAHVKSIDPDHLVASGHANMAVPFADLEPDTIDFGTWHGYPSYAKMSHADFDALIRRNCRIGEERGKPILLEEFGVPRTDPSQSESYRTWLATIAASPACPGFVVWRLVSPQDNGKLPTDDHDRFDVHNDGGATWNVLRAASEASRGTAKPVEQN